MDWQLVDGWVGMTIDDSIIIGPPTTKNFHSWLNGSSKLKSKVKVQFYFNSILYILILKIPFKLLNDPHFILFKLHWWLLMAIFTSIYWVLDSLVVLLIVENLFCCIVTLPPHNIEMAKCQYCSYLSFIYIQIYWVKFDIPRKGKLMSPNIQCLERELRLRLRPADLIWLLLYHFPHQQITLGQKHEYFRSVDKKQKIIPPPPPQSVIVNLLIFISFRFLSFNDVGDHLFKKIMFAPPYVDVQVVTLQFYVKWAEVEDI